MQDIAPCGCSALGPCNELRDMRDALAEMWQCEQALETDAFSPSTVRPEDPSILDGISEHSEDSLSIASGQIPLDEHPVGFSIASTDSALLHQHTPSALAAPASSGDGVQQAVAVSVDPEEFSSALALRDQAIQCIDELRYAEAVRLLCLARSAAPALEEIDKLLIKASRLREMAVSGLDQTSMTAHRTTRG